MLLNWKYSTSWLVLLGAFMGLFSPVHATSRSPQAFNFQGRLFNASGTSALEEVISLKLQILDPSASCLLYEETQSLDLSYQAGAFSVSVGSALGAPKRSAGVDPGFSMAKVFKNDPTSETRAQASGCPNGYTPTAGDHRLLRVIVTPLSTGIPEILSPDQTINSVPQALVAETLQGLAPSDFIQKDPIHITDQNVQKLFGSILGGVVDASDLHHHDGRYIQVSSSSSQDLGSGGFNTSGKGSIGTSSNFTTTTMSVKADADASVGLAVRANSSFQSADLFQVQNSAGTKIAGITARGELTAATSTLTSTGGNQLVVQYDTTNKQTVDVNSTGTTTFTAAGSAPKFSFMNGNIGIGTVTPAGLLSLAGAASTSSSIFSAPHSGATIFNHIQGPSTAITAGSTLFKITSNYTMGSGGSIAEIGPKFRIDENGHIYVSPDMTIGQGGGAATVSIGGSGNTNTIQTANSGSYSGTDLIFKMGNADRTAGNLFQISNFTAPVMTVAASSGGGYVGIGTLTPNRPLHVTSATAPTIILENTAGAVDKKRRYTSATSSGDMAWGKFSDDMSTTVEQMRLLSSGNLGLGVLNPSAVLHLQAGSSSADTAPLKFTSGVLLTTPENGAVEYNGTDFFITSGGLRRKIALTNATDDYVGVNSITGSGALTVSAGGANQNLTLAGSGTGSVTTSSPVAVTSATASSSSTTGAFVVSGGVGVGGNIFSGGNVSSAGIFLSPLGTHAAPSYSITGDDDTGIFSPAANTWAVSTAGTERMRIGSTGNIGIGTTTPTSKLSLGSGQVEVPFGTTTAPSYSFSGDLNTGIFNNTSDQMGFTTNGTTRLFLGTWATFAVPVEVAAGSAASLNFRFGADQNTGIFGTNSDVLAIATGGAERFRVDASGNVGIGTTTPTEKLHVVGNTLTSGTLTVSSTASPGLIIGNGSTGTIRIGDGQLSKTAGSGWIMDNLKVSGANWQNGITFQSGGANAGLWSAGTNILSFSTDIAERMRINPTGNVGIGTTTPDERLVVFNGTTTGKYTSTGWTHSSDKRLKNDIVPLKNSLKKILQLEGVNYKLKADPKKKVQIGFVAQDVEKVFPEVVETDDKGFKTMVYSNLVAPLVEAVKELNKRITGLLDTSKALSEEIATVKAENNKLKEENRSIKSYICSKDPKASICIKK